MPGREQTPGTEAPRPLSAFEERVRNRVMQLMRREKKVGNLSDEKFPRISLDFHFAPHIYAEDAVAFGEKIRAMKPQIVGVEMLGHSKQTESTLNALTAGKITPEQLMVSTTFESFSGQLMRELHNSKVLFIPLDFPNTEIERMRQSDAIAMRETGLHAHLRATQLPFPQALEYYRALMEEAAQDDKAREDYSLNVLEERIAQLIATDPKFKTLPNIKVLVYQGAVHTGMAHEMRSEHPDTRMRLPVKTFVYSHRSELRRRMMFKQPINQDVLTRSLAESIFGPAVHATLEFMRVSPRDLGNQELMRSIFDALTLEEIERMYELEILQGDSLGAKTVLVGKIEDALQRYRAKA